MVVSVRIVRVLSAVAVNIEMYADWIDRPKKTNVGLGELVKDLLREE